MPSNRRDFALTLEAAPPFFLWILVFALWLAAFPSVAQNVELGFAAALGGTDNDYGYGIAVDPMGNVFTTGTFGGTADFDPGPGTAALTSVGAQDVFVSKLDSIGNFVWAKTTEGLGFVQVEAIAVDTSGNVCVTGFFEDTVDFDPGVGTANFTSVGDYDIFVLKLDSDGNFLWAKTMGGTEFDYGYGIAVDAAGNVHVTGQFADTVDFDPGPGTSMLAGDGTFIVKLDSAGNFIWAKAIARSPSVGGYGITGLGIAVDADANVVTTGFFGETFDMDPGPGVSNITSAGTIDVFVCKLDSFGNFAWAKGIGGTGFDYGHALAVDVSGAVYFTGIFENTVDFDPSAGMTALSSLGFYDVFIGKLDSMGNFAWAKAMGGPESDYGNAVVVDVSGNVYTTGTFSGTVDFDPGSGTENRTSQIFPDIFVQKLESLGNFGWVNVLVGPDAESSDGIALDTSGNVYVTGSFSSTVDFDPGAGLAEITSAGGLDGLVVKFVVAGGGGGNCLISSMALGTSWDQELDSVRAFRDRFLLTNPIGSEFANWYYRINPAMVGWISFNAKSIGLAVIIAAFLSFLMLFSLSVRRRS
jgi:hypothetical protein